MDVVARLRRAVLDDLVERGLLEVRGEGNIRMEGVRRAAQYVAPETERNTWDDGFRTLGTTSCEHASDLIPAGDHSAGVAEDQDRPERR